MPCHPSKPDKFGRNFCRPLEDRADHTRITLVWPFHPSVSKELSCFDPVFLALGHPGTFQRHAETSELGRFFMAEKGRRMAELQHPGMANGTRVGTGTLLISEVVLQCSKNPTVLETKCLRMWFTKPSGKPRFTDRTLNPKNAHPKVLPRGRTTATSRVPTWPWPTWPKEWRRWRRRVDSKGSISVKKGPDRLLWFLRLFLGGFWGRSHDRTSTVHENR